MPVDGADTKIATAGQAAPKLEITASRQLAAWMAEERVSFAFTTYEAGKLFLIGLKPDGRLSIFERTFSRCMGLAAQGDTLWMSALYQLWRFENALKPGEAHEGYDRLYVPRVGYTTGDLDAHDVATDASGRPVFVNTLFSCLATVSDTASFVPLWSPPFVTRLAAEDRCHLNGVAMQDGRPRYCTAVARSDVADGWREHRTGGGLVIDVANGEAVCDGLSMPHSPRLHAGRLWLHDSGTGRFGFVDEKRGAFEAVAFCAGYLRGLAFVGDFAVAGISKLREDNRTFAGLPLEETLRQKSMSSRCGLQVIDLKSGDVVHWLRIEGVVNELYDVALLPGARRPMALGFKTDQIRRVITVGEAPQT